MSQICPRKLITRESITWLNFFASYRAGFLLEAGGLNDQPAIYLAAMHAIESLEQEARCPPKQNSR